MISVDSTKSFIFPKTLLITTKSSVTKSSVTKSSVTKSSVTKPSVIHSNILLDLFYVKKTQKKAKEAKTKHRNRSSFKMFF